MWKTSDRCVDQVVDFESNFDFNFLKEKTKNDGKRAKTEKCVYPAIHKSEQAVHARERNE